jgi:hypothetical protein
MAAAETVTVTVEWRCPLLPDQRRTNLIEELVASTAAAERSTSVHIRRGPHMKTYTKNGGLENDRDGLHITAEFQSPTTMRWVNFHIYLDQEVNENGDDIYVLREDVGPNPRIFRETSSELPKAKEAQPTDRISQVRIQVT